MTGGRRPGKPKKGLGSVSGRVDIRRPGPPPAAADLWMTPPRGSEARIQGLVFQMEQFQWWPPERLRTQQLRQLQALIDHAAKTVPYYEETLRNLAGLKPGRLSMEAVRGLPILTRTDIQEAGRALITRALPPEHGPMADSRTTGSTGQPVVVKATALTSLFYQALSLRYHAWHRRDLSLKNVTLKAMKPDMDVERLGGWAGSAITGPAFQFNHALPAARLLDMVVDEDPDYLQMHPSTLRAMIEVSEETGNKPKRLREVRTVSEVLDPEVRLMCERTWGVPIADNYSAQEFSIIALQCPAHPHLHVQSENVLVEVLDGAGQSCAPGQTGRLVITALNNFASPLIRYENGDFAQVGPPCPCGRSLPVLSRIAGRERNLAVLPNGDRVTPVLDVGSPLMDLPVRQYQYVQKSLEEIEVRLVVARPLTGDEEARIADFLARSLRHPFACRFVYVDEIPRLASGKYEVFRCEVAE